MRTLMPRRDKYAHRLFIGEHGKVKLKLRDGSASNTRLAWYPRRRMSSR
jgi:hypothetical protein